MQIYGCTDKDLLYELKAAFDRGIAIELFYDPSGSGPLEKKLPFAAPLPCNGLMHKKILIADEELLLIGSANLTPTSLRMHDNLVVGLYQKDLSNFIQHSTRNHITFPIGDQIAELWQLPDFQDECLNRILEAIEKATSSIHLALFTFTHPQILKALVKAQEKGVKMHVAIDFYSAKGASKEAIKTLTSAGICPIINQSGKLLHHKWALIDQNTLFLGSANWTKSAFTKNEDCLFILQNLTEDQKKYFRKIWKEIELNSLL